jgi:hypothetical protein
VVSRSSWNMVYLVQWYLVLREICYILYSGISFFVKYGISCTVLSRSSWTMVYLVQWYLVLREICYILYSGISFFVKYGISCTVVSRSSWNMVYLVQWYLVLRDSSTVSIFPLLASILLFPYLQLWLLPINWRSCSVDVRWANYWSSLWPNISSHKGKDRSHLLYKDHILISGYPSFR